MHGDVTKKDLQSLQGHCNKQMADLEKRLQAAIAESQKYAIDQINKTIRTLNENDAELLRGHSDQGKRLNIVSQAVNDHANRLKELQRQH